ncbi:UNVERIFIED_ORG: hypothetical protein LHK14_09840 [Roseateles sp. XES5]|nr:hypothetical protein [Roseateles sp. XES5]
MDGVLMVCFLSSDGLAACLGTGPTRERREPGGSPKIETGKAKEESQTGYPMPLKFHGGARSMNFHVAQHSSPHRTIRLSGSLFLQILAATKKDLGTRG